MPSNQAPDQNLPIYEDIEKVYRQYQQAHLYDTLETVAGEMERQLLQKRLANTLLNTDITISEQTKQTVKETKQNVGSDSLDKLEGLVESTETLVNDEQSEITGKIQEDRIDLHDTVEALEKLNNEIEFMSAERLSRLETLLSDWNWERKVNWDEEDSLDERLNKIEEFATEMREIFEDASTAVGDELEGTEVQTLVSSLLAGEGGVPLTELDATQREALAQSELADHIEISIG
jgi:hypothetical protein